jgi:hypothetical protein
MGLNDEAEKIRYAQQLLASANEVCGQTGCQHFRISHGPEGCKQCCCVLAVSLAELEQWKAAREFLNYGSSARNFQ